MVISFLDVCSSHIPQRRRPTCSRGYRCHHIAYETAMCLNLSNCITEIPGLPDRWVTKTPFVTMLCPQKKLRKCGSNQIWSNFFSVSVKLRVGVL
jgi:hypothetical protein